MRLVTRSFLLLLTLLLPEVGRAQYSYNDFTSTSGLYLVGSAVARNGLITLTPPRGGVAGGVWIVPGERITEGFITRFTFRIKDTLGQPDGEGRNGGDGIAFVISRVNGDLPTVGATGGQLGYGRSGTLLAVAF